MRAPRGQTLFRLGVILTFVGACVVAFGFFWLNAGGSIPLVSNKKAEYQTVFYSQNVQNIVDYGDVRMAGVLIGHVTNLETVGDRAKVEMSLDEQAPLHQGLTIRVGVKSIIGQSYIDVVDGKGPELPSGSVVPDSAMLPEVNLTDVLNDLNPQARAALSGSIKSLGAATDGQGQNISKVLDGLGDLGRQGYTALDAVSAQSEDLEQVSQEGGRLLAALDTGRGQIAQVVGDARTLTNATAGQHQALEDTLRKAPRLLDSAKTATKDITTLSGALSPIASDLRKAAPDVNHALLQLPDTTKDLRGLLPSLDKVLDKAPATLGRVPAVTDDVRALIPPVRDMLADANPVLAYAQPYGRDAGAMLDSFAHAMEVPDENGVHPVRLAPIFNSGSYRGFPNKITFDPTHWSNPYPDPNKAGQTGPYAGTYPRLMPEPR